MAEKYGAWGEKSMYGKKYMGMLRSTFIIDPKGKIARVFPKVQPKKHDELVLEALAPERSGRTQDGRAGSALACWSRESVDRGRRQRRAQAVRTTTTMKAT